MPGKGGLTGLLPQKAVCLHSKELEGFITVSQLLTGVPDKTSMWAGSQVVSSSWGASLAPLISAQLVFPLPLPWLATVQICPLKLREGHNGWSLAYKKWEKERPSHLQALHCPAQFQKEEELLNGDIQSKSVWAWESWITAAWCIALLYGIRLLWFKIPSVSLTVFVIFHPSSLLKKENLFTYLFLAALGLRCFLGLSLVAASRGYSIIVVFGLLIAEASLIAEHGL